MPAPTPGVLARPSFADRMRGKWGWAAAALVCLLGLIAGGLADALILGGLTALILGMVAIIRESRRQGSGSARAPWPHSSQEEPAFSFEGLPRRVRTRRSRTHQHRWRRPTRPNHRQHLNRHRPQQPRRVASQRSPRAAARPSSTSRSPLAESRRTDLEFACSRRCVSEAFLRTPRQQNSNQLGSVVDSSRLKDNRPELPRTALKKKFSPDATYKVGQCASGWIPFTTDETVTRIRYANGVGDRAIWDATDLSAKPKTETTEPKPAPRQRPKVDRAAKDYRNCTALNRDYPHGVGRPGARDRTRNGSQRVTNFEANRPLYDANSESDRDGDGIACEKP